jgi:uncharacterized membrane protein
MFTWYSLFKFLHVTSVVIWVGGMITLAVVNAWLARERNNATSLLLSRHSEFFGRAVIGPAAGITLASGIAMVGLTGWHLPLWVGWGFAGLFGSIALGATFVRRTGLELEHLSAVEDVDQARMAVLRRRLALLNGLNMVLLLSTLWAMVFKVTP